MKVKELPQDTDLTTVKVELPNNVLTKYKNYVGGEKEMYIVGNMMGDFFLSPFPKTTKGDRVIYPMPLGVFPEDILEWNVVKWNLGK